MSDLKHSLMKGALKALHVTHVSRLMSHWTRGSGIIFTLHRVVAGEPEAFSPNRILNVTPEFLKLAIEETLHAGYEIVSLDEVAHRIETGQGKPFAAFTFDDGYRDNRDLALPIFKAFNLPFAVYVPTEYPDGNGELWWLVLEEAIRRLDHLDIDLGGEMASFDLSTTAGKWQAFDRVYWFFRSLPERDFRARIRDLATKAGYDQASLCRDLIMSWDEIREFARDPLVTIGAHTRHHLALAKLTDDEVRAEMVESIARIERELGRPCRHFSYPYGDATSAGPREFSLARDLGIATAVTTHKDVVARDAKGHLTSLPRVSLNGDYQEREFLRVFLTGAPFALSNGAAKIVRGLKNLRPKAPAASPRQVVARTGL